MNCFRNILSCIPDIPFDKGTGGGDFFNFFGDFGGDFGGEYYYT